MPWPEGLVIPTRKVGFVWNIVGGLAARRHSLFNSWKSRSLFFQYTVCVHEFCLLQTLNMAERMSPYFCGRLPVWHSTVVQWLQTSGKCWTWWCSSNVNRRHWFQYRTWTIVVVVRHAVRWTSPVSLSLCHLLNAQQCHTYWPEVEEWVYCHQQTQQFTASHTRTSWSNQT